jgi:hypothetical protein
VRLHVLGLQSRPDAGDCEAPAAVDEFRALGIEFVWPHQRASAADPPQDEVSEDF